MPAYAAVSLVCLLVVFQGGYYAGATCAIGVLAVFSYGVYAMGFKKRVACSWVTSCLFGVACVYGLSALAHGSSASMLLATTRWFSIAGISLWCSLAACECKERALDALASAGVALSAFGILMYVGLVPFEGAVDSGRLMFTFQYANTAGVFFSVIAVLCLHSDSRPIRTASLVAVASLLLTQSVGAMLVFAIALIVIAVRKMASGNRPRFAIAVALVALLLVGVAVALAFPARIAQASQTFIERIVQMLDALALLCDNVLLGIGPDQWQFIYPAIQTAQYRATDVHCSYLQVALDAGPLALLLVFALLVMGFRKLSSKGDIPSLLCIGMIALHSVFDFDIQFSAIVALFALFASGPEESDRFGVELGKRAWSTWVLAACMLAASCGGIYVDMQVGQTRDSDGGHVPQRLLVKMGEMPFLMNDEGCQRSVIASLYQASDYQAVCDFQGATGVEGGAANLYHALALHQLGRDGEALDELARTLDVYPYDTQLYDAVRQLALDGKWSREAIGIYNSAALHANGLAREGHAGWLANQKQFEVIDDASSS